MNLRPGLSDIFCPRNLLVALLIAAAAAVDVACQDGSASSVAGGGSSSGSSTGGSSNSGFGTGGTVGNSSATDPYAGAKSVKVIFNKQGFFSNNKPSSYECAGDVKRFYDPLTDRAIPAGPTWLKNVGLDITNSNAVGGPSETVGCALSGLGAAAPSNCASFDDQQPLDGSSSRSVLVGGFGCLLGTAGCSPTAITNDIWNLSVPDSSTSSTYNLQVSALPVVTPLTAGQPSPAAGLVWHSGDFDELHNAFYIYGGVTPLTPDPTTTGAGSVYGFNNSIVKFSFNSDQSVQSSPGPQVLVAPGPTPASNQYSARRYYAGWASGTFDSTLASYFPPPAVAGHSFTYGLRRNPSLKSSCRNGDTSITGFNSPDGAHPGCQSAGVSGSVGMVTSNEADDYYLLTGGLKSNGLINDAIYLYKPHGYSNDIGTSQSDTAIDRNGDWTLVSNVPGTAANISHKVMRQVDISIGNIADITSGSPYVATDVGSARPNNPNDYFFGWVGRAYHATVYDPGMDRFYIFGGVENKGVNNHAPLSANAVPPDLATSDVWIYDPPGLGKRPTSLCFSNETPDGKALLAANAHRPMGASRNLNDNLNYAQSPFVFPPGGCLTRIKYDSTNAAGLGVTPLSSPPSRFGHGMVFDRDNKVAFVFGGCTSPGTIPPDQATNAGDPRLNCTRQSLLNDIWMWVPPSVTEIVPQTYRTATNYTSPFNPLTLLPNPFGTDFWLDHLPLFYNDDPGSGTITQPEPWRVLGEWIKLNPAGSPTLPPPRTNAAVAYDRAHHRIYVQGGYGCTDVNCAAAPTALNDLWVYTPPNFYKECPSFRNDGVCGSNGSGQGSWTQLRPNVDNSNTSQPSQRYGAIMTNGNNMFSYGDEYYTVTDSACQFQGPIATPDGSVNKQLVGSIYVDIDRNQFNPGENLLINLRFLPFDSRTRLPAFSDAGTPDNPLDDTDIASTSDTATIRVQLLANSLRKSEIRSSVQPRFHEFLSGTPTIGDTFTYVSGASGQVTEKQIFVPLGLDPSLNLIKIERVTGSVKFFEMTISKF